MFPTGPWRHSPAAGAGLLLAYLLGVSVVGSAAESAEPSPAGTLLGTLASAPAPAPPAGALHSFQLEDPPLPAVTNQVATAESTPATETGAHGKLPGNGPSAKAIEFARQDLLATQLALARQHRLNKDFTLAHRILLHTLNQDVPEVFKKAAHYELALLSEDAGELSQAQRAFAQYTAVYPQDPAVPEILLRQGLLYRRMDAPGLAVAKFYAVMTSALNLKLERLEHYERLVLRAQAEIADTHFAQGKFADAADLLTRLLKRDSPQLDKPLIHYRLIRCLDQLGRADSIPQAARFLELYPDSESVPEVRAILAANYKRTGRGTEAQRQLVLLLERQRDRARKNPEAWAYWQKRAGNEIANQFYEEGDFSTTLNLYTLLAELDATPQWRLPLYYQIGLVHERLGQAPKAVEAYRKILEGQKELTTNSPSPSLVSVFEMARWRMDALSWLDRARSNVLALSAKDATPSP